MTAALQKIAVHAHSKYLLFHVIFAKWLFVCPEDSAWDHT